MREVRIKNNKVVSQVNIVPDQFWAHLESFLDTTECHVVFGTIVTVNNREIPARKTYELKDGTLVLFDDGKPTLDIGVEVEIHTKLTRAENPKLEVRW